MRRSLLLDETGSLQTGGGLAKGVDILDHGHILRHNSLLAGIIQHLALVCGAARHLETRVQPGPRASPEMLTPGTYPWPNTGAGMRGCLWSRIVAFSYVAAWAAGVPAPWVDDPVLNLLASRWRGQQVVPDLAIASLDASTAQALSLLNSSSCVFTDIIYDDHDSAFWPAMNHTVRARTIATAFISPASAFFNSSAARGAGSCALGWWLDAIAAGSPAVQNPNWWFMQIGVGGYLAPTALLLWEGLSAPQVAALNAQLQRTSTAGMTGANLLWTAQNVLFRGILSGNRSVAATAVADALATLIVAPGFEEGIKADGSFMQHGAQLYNGGYGQSFAYDAVNVLALVAGTPLAASPAQVDLLGQFLVEGSLRMIRYGGAPPGGVDSAPSAAAARGAGHAGQAFGPPMWDVSVVGRDLTRPYGSSLQFGFGQSGQQVSFVAAALAGIGGSFAAALDQYAAALNGSRGGTPPVAVGNRHYYVADYMCHTQAGWMASVRMQSSRTLRSECVNGEGMLSLHLADGALYTYLSGTEYVDVFPAWDWERIPGTTVRSGAAPLQCATVQGPSSNAFTGGVSDSDVGAAVQSFVAPLAQGLALQRLQALFTDTIALVAANITTFDGARGVAAAELPHGAVLPGHRLRHHAATASEGHVAGSAPQDIATVVYTTIDSRRLNATAGVWVGPLPMTTPQKQQQQLAIPGEYLFSIGGSQPAPAVGEGGATPIGWLWHDSIGYVLTPPTLQAAQAGVSVIETAATAAAPLVPPLRVSLQLAATGAWASIGQEGAYGNATVPLFSAWWESTTSIPLQNGLVGYTAVPAISLEAFTAALAVDAAAFGVSFAFPGQWSASVRAGGTGPAAVAVFQNGSASQPVVVDTDGQMPTFNVTSAGAYALRVNASHVAVTAANPLQQPWTTTLTFAGLSFAPYASAGLVCSAEGVMQLLSPPADGSSATFTCALV